MKNYRIKFIKSILVFSGRFFAWEFSQKCQKQNYSYKEQAGTNIDSSCKISKINHTSSKMSSNLTAKAKNNIAQTSDIINTIGSLIVNIKTKNPDAIFDKTLDKTFKCDGRSSITDSIHLTINQFKLCVK